MRKKPAGLEEICPVDRVCEASASPLSRSQLRKERPQPWPDATNYTDGKVRCKSRAGWRRGVFTNESIMTTFNDKNYLLFKRLFDVFFAVTALILTFPLLILIAFCIKIFSKGPVFLLQKRIGKNNAIFTIVKFRTMILQKEMNGIKLTDSERLYLVGRYLRKLSIDELPQLLNILIGDMSFIGPRPLPAKYLPFFTEKENIRHKLRPGISGLAQVNGRNFLTWEQKFDFDIIYVKNICLRLDFIIFLKTLKIVFTSSGIATGGKDKLENSLHEVRMKNSNSCNPKS